MSVSMTLGFDVPSPYFGGCACEGEGTYKCNRLLGMCVRSKTGSLSKPECEASCGVTVEAAAAA